MASRENLMPPAGRWGENIDAPLHSDEPAKGEMTLEWLRDEKVMVQRSVADEPMFPESIAVVIPADSGDEFAVHYFDSRGVSRVYRMTFEENVWKMWREADGPDDFDQRFEGTLSEGGRKIEGAWRRVEDGEWLEDFELTYTRLDKPA